MLDYVIAIPEILACKDTSLKSLELGVDHIGILCIGLELACNGGYCGESLHCLQIT